MKTVDIYIDTSLRGPGRKPEGRWMYIIAAETQKGTADTGESGRLENTSENQLNVTALDKALERLRIPCRIILHVECDYLAAAIRNRWYEEWKYHNWQNARGKPVADTELWQRIEWNIQCHEVEVVLRRHHEYRDWMEMEMRGGAA